MTTQRNSNGLSSFATAFSFALEQGFAKAFQLEPENALAFAPLQGKVIAVVTEPFNSEFYLLVSDNKTIAVQQTINGEADCKLKVSLSSWLSPTKTAFYGVNSSKHSNDKFQAQILSGDNETAQQFISAMQQLEFDLEEWLSQYSGDLLAFKIGHAFRQTLKAKHHSEQQLINMVKEYLLFEINAVVAKHQLDDFVQQVQQTQIDVDNIEHRIQQLQSNFNKA